MVTNGPAEYSTVGALVFPHFSNIQSLTHILGTAGRPPLMVLLLCVKAHFHEMLVSAIKLA